MIEENGDTEMNADEIKVKAAKKLQQKLQQAKICAYLTTLTEQKKKDEIENRKKDERTKRRMSILKERIFIEATEKKLMNQEDQLRYQLSNQNDNLSNDKNDKITKIVNSNEMSAIINRLSSKRSNGGKDDLANNIPIRDFADWKRKNGVPPDGQVFVMTGWYPSVKQALLDRGWFFNPESSSPYCDLKWTLRSLDVDTETLQPWQLTNHFMKNVAITTKVGLLKSLKNLIWLADVDIHEIIPRGYDLSNPYETKAFIDDFQCQRCINILTQVCNKVVGIDSNESKSNMKETTTSRSIDQVLINPAVLETCCSVLERLLQPYEEDFLDRDPTDVRYSTTSLNENVDSVTTALDWEIISYHDIFAPSKLAIEPLEPIDGFLKDQLTSNDSNKKNRPGEQHREMKMMLKNQRANRSNYAASIQSIRPLSPNDLKRIKKVLQRYQDIFPHQYALNGNAKTASVSSFHNTWIVKPAAKSRGRGISTFTDLNKLLKYVDAGESRYRQFY
jgi:tubulin monoglycylase TTLL3/8